MAHNLFCDDYQPALLPTSANLKYLENVVFSSYGDLLVLATIIYSVCTKLNFDIKK